MKVRRYSVKLLVLYLLAEWGRANGFARNDRGHDGYHRAVARSSGTDGEHPILPNDLLESALKGSAAADYWLVPRGRLAILLGLIEKPPANFALWVARM